MCNNFIHNHWMVPNCRPIFYDLYITSKYSFLCPFSFMCFKKCFIIFFMIFLDFQFDVFPLEYMKNKEIGFSFIQVGNMSNFKSRNNWVYPLLVLFLFTGPIILAKGMIWYNEQLSKIYTGWSKKNVWFDQEEKCLRNSKMFFLWSLSLYIFTSSHEVRSF